MRGFGVVARHIKRFLEEHGYRVHLGAWVDVMIGNRLVFDFQIGHWAFMRHPHRGVPAALYVVTEGPIPRRARAWLRDYQYLFCPSRFVKAELERIDLDCILMPHGIDTKLFRPLPVPKFIDVLAIGIHESPFDDRKFMRRVLEASFPWNTYVHTRPTLPYEELPRLYSSARVYLSLSGCEAFNIPLVEANACGLPAVINDACASGEVGFGVKVKPVETKVVDIGGIPYYFNVPNIEAIRRALGELLRSPARLRELGSRAREHALRFDYRLTFKPLLEVLPRP